MRRSSSWRFEVAKSEVHKMFEFSIRRYNSGAEGCFDVAKSEVHKKFGGDGR